jgi:quinol monooxygenase YgiN
MLPKAMGAAHSGRNNEAIIYQESRNANLSDRGAYQVEPSAVDKTKQAIEQFVHHVRENEPDTQMYLAWQHKDDHHRFIRLFIFADKVAQERHGKSEAVKRFEAVHSSELVGGDVVFTSYEMIAGKRWPRAARSDSPITLSRPTFCTCGYQTRLRSRSFAALSLQPRPPTI